MDGVADEINAKTDKIKKATDAAVTRVKEAVAGKSETVSNSAKDIASSAENKAADVRATATVKAEDVAGTAGDAVNATEEKAPVAGEAVLSAPLTVVVILSGSDVCTQESPGCLR